MGKQYEMYFLRLSFPLIFHPLFYFLFPPSMIFLLLSPSSYFHTVPFTTSALFSLFSSHHPYFILHFLLAYHFIPFSCFSLLCSHHCFLLFSFHFSYLHFSFPSSIIFPLCPLLSSSLNSRCLFFSTLLFSSSSLLFFLHFPNVSSSLYPPLPYSILSLYLLFLLPSFSLSILFPLTFPSLFFFLTLFLSSSSFYPLFPIFCSSLCFPPPVTNFFHFPSSIYSPPSSTCCTSLSCIFFLPSPSSHLFSSPFSFFVPTLPA